MKFLTFSCISLLAFSASATEITSPFYLPEMGHVLNQTNAHYTKNKMKANPTIHTYQRSVNDELTIGLGTGLAALINGDINWTKQKQGVSFSAPHTTGYAAGLKGQFNLNSILVQLSTLYHQTTDIHFSPRRQIEADLRLGKELKTMTPYLHLNTFLPLNARPEINNPIYLAETGVFQNVNDKMTLDSALYLRYDKNIKGRSYGIREELSYLITSWMAFGIKGEWQARGKAKNGAHTYHKSAGINLRFSF